MSKNLAHLKILKNHLTTNFINVLISVEAVVPKVHKGLNGSTVQLKIGLFSIYTADTVGNVVNARSWCPFQLCTGIA